MEVSNCWKMNKKILIKTLNHKKLKLMNRCNNSVALNRFRKLKIQTDNNKLKHPNATNIKGK